MFQGLNAEAMELPSHATIPADGSANPEPPGPDTLELTVIQAGHIIVPSSSKTTERCRDQDERIMAKERERFYLLPGMGGRALRQKRKLMLQWSIVTGLFVSALVAGVIYLIFANGGRL